MTITKETSEKKNAEDAGYATSNISAEWNNASTSGLQRTDNPAVTNAPLQEMNIELEAPEILQARDAVSHPMTASSSTSSNPSLKDTTIETASPYGTRSRNRAGASRPNYAEDREIETEFEVQPAKEDGARKGPRSSDSRSSTSLESSKATNVLRRASQADVNCDGQGISMDHIPGTSTFSANPTASAPVLPMKKRKATTQVVSNNGTALIPVANSGPPGSQVNTRRASIATQSGVGLRDSSMLSFDDCACQLTDGRLLADDGTILQVNDHVYLVCEPPGEPYYLGRIMEFLHINNDEEKAIDALRINWYYRPKDIGRKIKHKSEVQSMEEYRKAQNCFWYEKLYDRYIHRYYEVIPTSQIVNVPANVKTVLDERWRFILVESGRGKELTSAVKSCKRCSGYCASNDSVDCAVCHHTYHMNCVRPPLLKKPSRGFAWACGPCSRAQERKLEARNTPNLAEVSLEAEEEELVDEEEEGLVHGEEAGTGRTSPDRNIDGDLTIHPGTAEQIYQASLWPFRYLGVHCKVEDALDYDDRIYPRASSRLGPRHQANISIWPGRPVELVKPTDIKKKYVKGGSHKKDAKLSKETLAAMEADKIAREKRPKWIIDEPPGYVRRGDDYHNSDPNNTAELLFKPPDFTDDDSTPGQPPSKTVSILRGSEIDEYMIRAKELAKHIGVQDYSVNFLDKALNAFCTRGYDLESALGEVAKLDKTALKEPEFTTTEIKKFEDGVSKFGSELHSVKKHVKTASFADIVRYYYSWKKTDRGKQVWGNYSGRKGKKEAKRAEASAIKLQDDVADDYDDSAFDNEKASEKKRGFQCKFCSCRTSRQWRRAPNTAAGTTIPADPSSKTTVKDRSIHLMVALCLSCAVVWRKYAVQWDDGDDHGRKAAQNGGRTGKRKVDEPLNEFQINEFSWTAENTEAANTPTGGTPIPQILGIGSVQEPARKKAKIGGEKDQSDPTGFDFGNNVGHQKKKIAESIVVFQVPEMPKPKVLSCSICLQMDPTGEQHLSCRECRMTVHRNCYGVVGETRGAGKWVCDMCSNDRNPQVSVHYKCTLCPVEFTEQDFIEPPKVSHKKKTEKEREKDRIEREQAQKAADYYRKRQEESGRPVNPREPLKRTANNNWVHVTCAVWTPEVKFGNAKALEPSESIPSIPLARYEEICKACKRRDNGACVSCHACRAPVHVECAHQAGYILGFDIAPVKGSRRDQFNIVNINGEVGTMTAAIWCKEHVPTKTIVHRMHDIVDDTGLNALQLYVQNFKQADLALTGTVRKATLINQSTKLASISPSILTPNRRTSTATVLTNGGRGSLSHVKLEDSLGSVAIDIFGRTTPGTGKALVCLTCGIDVSPRWWQYPTSAPTNPATTQGAVTSSQRSQSQPISSHIEANSSQASKSFTNGQPSQRAGEGAPKHHVALAVAALEERTKERTNDRTLVGREQQCHKCHYKGIRKAPGSPPQTFGHVDDVPYPRPLSSARNTAGSALASPQLVQVVSHLPSWPVQRAYSPPESQIDWSRPSAPPSQPMPIVHKFNGHLSPGVGNTNGQHLVGQNQARHSAVPLTPSPHTNGPLAQQVNTSYSPSPHHTISTTHQRQNGGFISYSPSTPAPHHLTNGGPPLRAPENPFSNQGNNISVHQQSPFVATYGSPSTPREVLPVGHELSNQAHSARVSDGRVNGGASANPALHNLLS